MNTLTYLVAGFLIINLAIGLWAGRDVKTVEEYAIDKGKWSVGALVATYMATAIGDGYIYSIPAFVFSGGISIIFAELCFPIFHIFCSYFIAKKIVLYSNCISIGEMLQKMYGSGAQLIFGIVASLHGLTICGLSVYGIAIVMNKFLGLDIHLSLVFSGITLVAYTVFGGIRSVIATDILQFILLGLSIVLVTVLAVDKLGGPVDVMVSITKERLSIFNDSKLPIHISMFIIVGVFQSLINEPPRMQRMLMASYNAGKFKKVFSRVAILEILILIILMFMGFSCYLLYPESDPLDVMFTLVNNLAGESLIMRALVCIGMISVLLSTGDSFLHAASISLYNDLIIKSKSISSLFKKRGAELSLVKLCVVFLGLLSICFAYFNGYRVRLDYVLGIMGPTVTAPLLLGLLGFKSSPKTFWLSAVSGLSCCLILLTVDSWVQQFAVVVAMLINFLTFIIGRKLNI